MIEKDLLYSVREVKGEEWFTCKPQVIGVNPEDATSFLEVGTRRLFIVMNNNLNKRVK